MKIAAHAGLKAACLKLQWMSTRMLIVELVVLRSPFPIASAENE
jgi:hypothetical protein